jgi:putative DNA primase/helicase
MNRAFRENASELAAKARAVPIENELARRGSDDWLHPRNSNKGAPCPMCGAGTDRFSVNTKKQVFLCRICGAKGDVIDLVRALDGVGYLDAITYLAGAAPQSTDCSIHKQTPPASRQPNENAERQRNINAAWAVWQRRRPIAGTLAERYLAGRGLPLDEDLSHVVGFDPQSHWREVQNDPASPLLRVPCLLAVYRMIDTDEIVAVQKTRLSEDLAKLGKHLGRRLNGCPKGAAIKLDADENVTQGLGLGEGLETCLSARVLGFRPVWAAGGTGALETFPVLDGIEALTLFLEHDKNAANARAVDICTQRWVSAGKQVFHAEPPAGADDMNDILQKRIARA